ncbi:ABC transporter permease [Streptomyces sp. NPDC058155]|uniref:ABC transporter permease n=1 Tax=Streptomyces sp. NPDC058155 TaxID=3346359 RepID=UPI0036E97B42
MRGALHAEWTKLRTVPSTWWLLLAVVVLTVTLGAAATGTVSTDQCPSPDECHEDTVKLSLTGVWLGQAAVGAFGVLAMSSEYGTGTIHATLAAVPGRARVLAAKAAVVTGGALAAGTLAVLGSLLAGRLILPGNGFSAAPLSLAEGPTLRAAVGTVLYFGLTALLALGVAALVRDTAGAITTVLGLLYALPAVVELVGNEEWRERIREWAPASAGLAVQATKNLEGLPISPWSGLAVLAGWAGAGLLAGAAVFRLRDA